MQSQLITQSEYDGTEYYLFRHMGNNQYKEIPFRIVKNELEQRNQPRLHETEITYIKKHYLNQ